MNPAQNAPDAERLIVLLTEQRDLYGRLRELSDRQRSLISGDRPEQLLGILQERQTLISSLSTLNEQLAPFRREWDAMYARLPEESRERTSALLNEINALLKVILKTDREDSVLLAARKHTVAQELSGVAGGKNAANAYARQSDSPASGPSADVSG